jgi:flagellin-specific chaperone FliS
VKSPMAYTQCQAVTLDGQQAFEELYTRLARWAQESAESQSRGDWSTSDSQIDRCISLLGFMDRVIDVSQNYEIASAILSLHRFAIGAFVKAKAQRNPAELDGLPKILISLAEIFGAICASRETPNKIGLS